MPLNLDQPKEEVIEQEVKEVFDSVKVMAHFVDNEKQQIQVLYKKYNNGELINDSPSLEIIDGQSFLDIAMAPPSGSTRYEDIKSVLYNYMINELGLTGTIV